MTKAWHYAWAGKSEGPVDAAHMEDLIRAGRVVPDTLVWAEGMARWEEARNHFAFGAAPLRAGAMVPPPPMPAQGASGPLYPGAPARSFPEAIKVCFQKYITFKGRASRSEYWWFALFIWLGSLVGTFLELAMGSDGQVLNGLFGLATFLPSLSVQVRRLHDINRSGWWIGGLYLALIAGVVIGGAAGMLTGQETEPSIANIALILLILLGILGYIITMLIFLVRRGDTGPNRFG